MTDENNQAAAHPAADEMSAFFTKDAANAGVKIPLVDPLGNKTGHWLEIYGVDSDQFRIADARGKREAAKIASIESIEERDLALVDLTRRLTASLVFNWSFSAPCTQEAVVEFFRKAPQIQEAVDFFASRRAFFYAKSSANSVTSQLTSSGSTDPQPEAPSP